MFVNRRTGWMGSLGRTQLHDSSGVGVAGWREEREERTGGCEQREEGPLKKRVGRSPLVGLELIREWGKKVVSKRGAEAAGHWATPGQGSVRGPRLECKRSTRRRGGWAGEGLFEVAARLRRGSTVAGGQSEPTTTGRRRRRRASGETRDLGKIGDGRDDGGLFGRRQPCRAGSQAG